MTQAVRAAMTRCGLRELPFAFDLHGSRVAQEVVSTEWSPFAMPPAGVTTADYRELADS